jgi:hypothetical protein
MKKRAKATEPTQVGAGLLCTAQQLLLPMIEGIIHSRRELFGWVQQVGISMLKELFQLDVVQLAGPKGKHAAERSHYRWGSAAIALPFGGRRMAVGCPRVRGLDGAEAQLKSGAQFRAADPVPARVLNQILLGVSTRGYAKSLEPAPEQVVVRGASKSAASRHLIARMTDQLRAQLKRRLDELELLVLMLDGIEIAHHTMSRIHSRDVLPRCARATAPRASAPRRDRCAAAPGRRESVLQRRLRRRAGAVASAPPEACAL